MANKTYQTRVQSKIDTSENWAKATNFVPLKGEICIYSDLQGQVKIGDGTNKIEDLSFSRETFIYSLTMNSSGVPTASATAANIMGIISKGFYDVRLRYVPTNSNDCIYIPFTNSGNYCLDFSCVVDSVLYEVRLSVFSEQSFFRTTPIETDESFTDTEIETFYNA